MNQKWIDLPILAITSGEPAGIGPDICLDLAFMDFPCRCVVLGDKDLLMQRAGVLGKQITFYDFNPDKPPENPLRKGDLEVCHIPLNQPCVAGSLNKENASYVLELLDCAYQGISDGLFAGMVTAPLHKGIINEGLPESGFFSGHTEYLAEKSLSKQVVMMLAGGGMRVALVTTHLPLKEVADAITEPLISSVVNILNDDLQSKFGIQSPRILVAGLNPHAGEGGHLGREEIDVIIPTLEKLKNQGIDVRGPYPADTLFQPFMLKDADAVLAMYHDQGLPTLKYAGFGTGVNVTLGLPFIRTSVDHGTALDLAATGQADSGSLMVAVETALIMANSKIVI